MIEGSIKKVEDGTKIANTTAEALYKIVEGVSNAITLIENIAVASNEQFIGVDQVNQGITQIAAVVQTTSATSEETDDLNPEVLKMLDTMNEKKTRLQSKKIQLSDEEFGKY